jgi:branched-chain amino acid transport system permease protein
MTVALQAVLDALSVGGLYALIALGIGLIFGIMRLVNFAHGDLVMVGGYTMFLMTGRPDALTALIALVVVVALALAVERVAFRPLRNASMPSLMIASFAVSYLLQHAVMVTIGAETKGVQFAAALNAPVRIAELQIPLLQLVTVAATLVLLILLTAFLRSTALGLQMRAAAENIRVARLMGVRANRVIAWAFAMSGLLAGAVALLYIAQVGAMTPQFGVQPALIGFVATVVGGLGSLAGAVIGGFLIGGLTVVLQLVLPLELRPFREAFLFGLLFIVLLVRPQGIVVVRWSQERV